MSENCIENNISTSINITEEKFKEGPEVSVCITNYNYAKYIEQCVLSVVNQSYKNIQLYIIDDCSTDDSKEKLEAFERKYENVHCIYNEVNKGYKYGIKKFIDELCSGKYFIIVSADDYLANDDTIEQFLKAIDDCDETIDFVYGDVIINNEATKVDEYINMRFLEKAAVVSETFKRYGSGALPFLYAIHRADFYRKNNYSWSEFEECSSDALNSIVAIKRGANYGKIRCPMFVSRQHGNNDTFNYEGRVRDISAIINYIVDNFDVRVYSSLNITDEKGKMEYLIEYYYKLIIYYIYEYKAFGTTEVNLTREEKIKFLKRVIDRCVYYIESYKTKYESDELKRINLINEEIKWMN